MSICYACSSLPATFGIPAFSRKASLTPSMSSGHRMTRPIDCTLWPVSLSAQPEIQSLVTGRDCPRRVGSSRLSHRIWWRTVRPLSTIARGYFITIINPILGGLWKVRFWAGAFSPPPLQISKTTHRSDKRQTAFVRSLKDLQLLHKTFYVQFDIEVTIGHQR